MKGTKMFIDTTSSKFRALRLGVAGGVGLATFAVVNAIVKNNAAEPESKTQKVTLAVGSYALGHMVAEKASNWADRKLLSLVATADGVEQQIKDQNTTDPK